MRIFFRLQSLFLDFIDWCLRSRIHLSVKEFGAVGDGFADDGNAIQACLDACPNRGTIIFPEGTYLIGKTLTLQKSVQYLKGYSAALLAGKQVDVMVLSPNKTRVFVSNLNFQGNTEQI